MSIQVDWALIQQLISEYNAKKYVDSCDGYKIFHHCLGTDIEPSVYDIIDQGIDYSTRVELMLEEDELIVLAPPSLLPQTPKNKKRRTKGTASAAAAAPREFLMRIPIEDQTAEDYVLFKECSKLGIDLTQQIGPYLELQPGRISLTFGLHLSDFCAGGIPDTANRQSVTAGKVFARVLDKPEMTQDPNHEQNLQDMFEALTTPKSFSNESITVPGVLTPLQKFQCQSVRWCLAREGVQIDGNNNVSSVDTQKAFGGWYKVDDWWVNPYNTRVQRDEPEQQDYLFGGLLAEEMGLGKTLEIISLLKLHPRPDSGIITNENTGQEIRKVAATLVIVPSGIMDQWITELDSHAPGLKIIQYSGKGAVTPDDLDACDVVLASYSTIASEFYAAQFNPGQRNTRFWKEREDIRSVRSSLVQVQFWRVILDEVQMLHAGVNNAARVAGLVPRVNAWAVTGTPVKNSMSDLRGQLSFLKVATFSGKRAFDRLLTMPDDFKTLVAQVGIRHTKFLLRDELKLPPQSRRLIMLKFNEMERLFYENVREEYSYAGFDESDRTLRTLLVKLRQACCINSTREQSVFSDSNGATLTVEQALLQLTFEGESRYTRLLRHKIGLFIELAQLQLMEGSPLEAIELLNTQLEPLESEISKSITQKDETAEKKKVLEEQIKASKAEIKDMTFDLELLGQKIAGFGLGAETDPNAPQKEEEEEDSQLNQDKSENGNIDASVKDEDETDDDHPMVKSEPGKEQAETIKLSETAATEGAVVEGATKGAIEGTIEVATESVIPKKGEVEVVDVSSNPEFNRKRFEIVDKETALDDLHVTNHYYSSVIKGAVTHINACKELQHRAYFFLGTAYYRLGQRESIQEAEKQDFSAKELEFYTKADDMRNELLGEEQVEFMTVRDKLKEPTIFEYEDPSNIYQEFFNSQAQKMKEIHSDLMVILRSGLLEMDAENEDVYTTSMEIQDKGYVYLNALQSMLRDREQILNGTQEVKKGKRKRSEIETHNEERSESAELLEKELKKQINQIREPVDNHELAERRRIQKANEARFKKLEREYRRKKDRVGSTIESDIHLEKMADVVHEKADTLKSDLRAWKREVGVLSDVFNVRLKYFKSLQSISDHVRDPEFIDTKSAIKSAITRKNNYIREAETDLHNAESRLKFIAQLEVQMPDERESASKDQESDECVICQDTYVHGSFTTCGHRCCTTCLKSWLSKNPICPICKTSLSPSDVFQFKFGEQPGDELNEAQEPTDDLGNDVYEHISPARFNEIVRQPLKKTYGIKIDMIVRHVLLLKQREPQVQIVIFTQWNRMLQALTHALIQHGIKATRKAQSKSVTHFRTNKDITCFMLHTSNDSAGLTLTNATHVILCEPLLTTAIELQAISRIHRIGQVHPTTVWLFAIQDTVEQQILALATERRVELAKQKRQSDEAIESDIITSTVGQLVDRSSGSEVVVEKDMRRILGLDQ